jgi:hypothetical protein
MLSHLEPYLLMPSALTPTALAERAAAILANLSSAEPGRLRHTPLYDAWLVPWERTDVHTHDAFAVYVPLTGALRETALGETALGEAAVTERVIGPGERITYRPGDTHRLTPDGETLVLALHSPPRRVPAHV